jgi:DNA-binding MarR family transcriptional regulator
MATNMASAAMREVERKQLLLAAAAVRRGAEHQQRDAGGGDGDGDELGSDVEHGGQGQAEGCEGLQGPDALDLRLREVLGPVHARGGEWLLLGRGDFCEPANSGAQRHAAAPDRSSAPTRQRPVCRRLRRPGQPQQVRRGRMRVRELAATLQWEKSRVSKHLGRMVARGLLAREPCATDQRGAVIVLTDTGRRAFAGAQPVHLTHLRKLLIDALSTEQLNTFGELAEIILTHIDALDRDHDGEDAEEVAGRTGV